MELVAMELIVTLILGGVTGWLARILVKADVRMGILVSVVVGMVGSLLGVAAAGALGLHPQSAAHGIIIVVVTAILAAAWLVGMLRAAVGLYYASSAWR